MELLLGLLQCNWSRCSAGGCNAGSSHCSCMGWTLILQSGMPAVAGTSDAEGVGLVLLWLNSTQRGHVSDQVVESLVGESSPRKMVRDILRDYAGARAGTGGVIAR